MSIERRAHQAKIVPNIRRRDALRLMGSGFGMVGLASLLRAAPAFDPRNPLAVRQSHFPAKAKNVIFLFLNGGVSQVDTFDYKPMLEKWDGKLMLGGNPATERRTGTLMRSPFSFKNYGESGIAVSDIFPHLGGCADDLCVIRSMYTDSAIHEPCLIMMNTGNLQPGRPSLGSWLTYGLGTENQNLPGFIVLAPSSIEVGPPMWNSAFLPAAYQGTHLPSDEDDPEKLIQFIKNEKFGLVEQRQQLDALQRLNQRYLQSRPDPQLEAAVQSMEVAFRMQTEAPEAFSLKNESAETQEQYGDGNFAWGCLMARRLVERGVRIVQVYFERAAWDSHLDILNHRTQALTADKPIAALLKDLKSRGLLQQTLVVIASEFGRTPSIERNPSSLVQNGRDHNPYGFSTLLAGGGVKGGAAYGSTDEFGFRAVEKPVHVHDLHATILHLLGLDHTKLTYPYSGRDFRLTDVDGNVIKDIIA